MASRWWTRKRELQITSLTVPRCAAGPRASSSAWMSASRGRSGACVERRDHAVAPSGSGATTTRPAAEKNSDTSSLASGQSMWTSASTNDSS